MLGIVFATKAEADPLLNALNGSAECVGRTAFGSRFFTSEIEMAVGIVGMGKGASAAGTASFLEQYQPAVVINAGIAGALDDSLTLGAVYRVSQATDRDAPDAPASVWRAVGVSDLPAARLVTSAAPVFSADIRAALRPLGEMVDMEGIAVGRVCAERGVPIVGLKCISDFANDGDRTSLLENLHRASAVVATAILSRLSRF